MCGKDKQETNANGEIVEKDKYAKYKEKPLDPNDEVKNGPYEDDKRQCRDCFCCIFFIVFIIGIIVVSYLGLYKGHPELILYPYDSDQNQCGRGDAKDYKYLYFYKFIDDTYELKNTILGDDWMIHGMCVKSCDPLKDDAGSKVMDCFTKEDSATHEVPPDCKVDEKNYYKAIEGKHLNLISLYFTIL